MYLTNGNDSQLDYTTTTTTSTNQVRSNEYNQLLIEIKDSFTSPVDIANRLYEQGSRDGLSKEVIRRDIETALAGVIKERQLMNVLPLELKRTYTKSKSAMIAQLATDSISKHVYNPTPAQQAIAFSNSMKQQHQPEPEDADLDEIDKPVDESLLYNTSDYRIELLDQYDIDKLRTIVKHLHNEVIYLTQQINKIAASA